MVRAHQFELPGPVEPQMAPGKRVLGVIGIAAFAINVADRGILVIDVAPAVLKGRGSHHRPGPIVPFVDGHDDEIVIALGPIGIGHDIGIYIGIRTIPDRGRLPLIGIGILHGLVRVFGDRNEVQEVPVPPVDVFQGEGQVLAELPLVTDVQDIGISAVDVGSDALERALGHLAGQVFRRENERR